MWYQWLTIILMPTKHEDDGEAELQVAEPVVQAGEQEVQRPQAEDGEGVRGEHDELLAADGQDGGHRVDGEHDVGGLDQDRARRTAAWPAACRSGMVNSFWPSYSVVDGTTLRTSLSTRLFSGWTSCVVVARPSGGR